MTRDLTPDPAVRELVHALVEHTPPAPPFPRADEHPRASRGPRAAIVAFVVLALVAGTVAVVAHHSSRTTRPTSTTHTVAAPGPAARPEHVAYVGRAGLITVDAAGHERVLVTGRVTNPAWSRDGAWLAFQRTRVVGIANPEQDLWVVAARGGAPRELLANVGQWSWSPTNPSALAAVVLSAGFVNTHAEVVLADGSWRWTAPVGSVTGVAWANRGGRLAIAYGTHLGVLAIVDVFDPTRDCVEPCPGPIERIHFSAFPPGVSLGAVSFDFTLILDRYTSDDRAVLAWLDPLGSGSIALDGITLIAIPAGGGAATLYPRTLVMPAWVRDAPTSTDSLVVGSNGRAVTDPRQIQRCNSAGACHALVAGVQTMDPAWSPDGRRIAYVRNDARGGNTFPPSLPSLYAQRLLWVADADGTHAHEVTAAGKGVAVLGWTDASHVVAVIGGRVRSVEVATGGSSVLTGALGQPGMTLPPDGAYEPTEETAGLEGFTSWASLVAFSP